MFSPPSLPPLDFSNKEYDVTQKIREIGNLLDKKEGLTFDLQNIHQQIETHIHKVHDIDFEMIETMRCISMHSQKKNSNVLRCLRNIFYKKTESSIETFQLFLAIQTLVCDLNRSLNELKEEKKRLCQFLDNLITKSEQCSEKLETISQTLATLFDKLPMEIEMKELSTKHSC